VSERNRWSHLDYTNEAAGLGPEATFKYGVPYEWGALHVTADADEAYGFVPLVAGVIKGGGIDMEQAPKAAIRTDIYLMSPREFIDQADNGLLPSAPFIGDIGYGAAGMHKGGLELRVALAERTEEVERLSLDAIASHAKEIGSEIDDMRTADDIPVVEAISQDASQFLVHGLTSLITNITRESAIEFMTADRNKKALREVTHIGGLGLAGAGLVLGANGILNGEVDAVSASTAMMFVGFYSNSARRFIKRHLAESNLYRHGIDNTASAYADTVAEDIHTTYCTAHFDQQAEEMLRNS
jgi:hypothetical protein